MIRSYNILTILYFTICVLQCCSFFERCAIYLYSILLFFLIVLRRFCVLMHCACRRRRRCLDNIKMFIIIYCCSQCTSRAIYNMRIIIFYAVNTHTGPAADSYILCRMDAHSTTTDKGRRILIIINIHT